jgi:hypothetical protein
MNRRKYTKRLLVELIKNGSHRNILDIGSGIQNWSHLFSSDVNYHTVDLRNDVGASHVGDFFTMNFDQEYDLIIATELVEHLPNTSMFFKRSSDLLAQNGLLLISFPFLFKIHADPSDFYRFTLQGIEEKSKFHFDIIRHIHHGNKIQLIWETIVDGKHFYPLKALNSLVARIDYKNKFYPLGYVLLLQKKSCTTNLNP